MTKPIFVIYLKTEFPLHRYDERFTAIKKGLESDYHVLFLQAAETKCELFSGEKIEPIEIEELKALLNSL